MSKCKSRKFDKSLKCLLIGMSLFLLAVNILASGEVKAPQVNIVPCKTSPKIDGKLDDSCWKNAYTDKEFYLFRNPSERLKDTILKITADPEYLYLGVKCLHPSSNDMKVTQFRNNQGRIFGDECIKMFINPGVKGEKFFRYVLNPANTSKISNHIGRNKKWKFLQTVWPSATSINADGWSAEIAIPLVYLAAHGDIKNLRMNLFRRKVVTERDANAVAVGQKDTLSSWAPLYRDWIEENNDSRIKGLEKIMSGRAFLAVIRKAAISNIYRKDGKSFIDVTMTLMPLTHKGGWVTIKVEDCPEKGKGTVETKKFRCYRAYNDAKFTFPVAKIGPREIKITVFDNKTGGVMDKRTLASKAQLRAFLNRTYYTNETKATISCNITFPGSDLDGKLILTCLNGKIRQEKSVKSLNPKITLPLKDIPIGRHDLKIAFNIGGKELFSTKLRLRKLLPKPGLEWKVDRVNRIILKDGKPFFPFGVWGHCTEATLKEYRKLGFNTIKPMGLKYIQKTPENVPAAMKLAQKYGIHLLFRPTVFSKPAKNPTIERLVTKVATRKKIYTRHPGANFILMTKCWLALDPELQKLTREERNEIFNACFENYRATMKKCIELTKNQSGLLAWVSIDEPSLRGFDVDIVLRKIYDLAYELDGYHPVFVLYSSEVPPSPKATEGICDVLGVDPYWTPGAPEGSYRWNIDFVAKCTALLEQRCRKDHLVNWITPQASTWSDVHKRPITGKEFICQTYLSLIYGAKAITYYLFQSASHQEQFDAFKRLSREIKILTPALLSPAVPASVSYKPGIFNPKQNIYPDVHAGLIRYPGKGYLLLAANSKNYPVSVTFTVPGISGEVKNLFGGKILSRKNDSFGERLKPMEVRAYVIKELKIPARIQVTAKRLPGGFSVEKGYPKTGRPGCKNLLPNSGFEECYMPNCPNYYRVRGTPVPRVGNPDCCWGSYPDQPYEGKVCLKSKGRGWFFYIAPKNPKPAVYKFSIYMRTDKPGTIIRCNYLKKRKQIKLTDKNWKQYSFTVEVPARVHKLSKFFVDISNPDATVWFDAMSFEKISGLVTK